MEEMDKPKNPWAPPDTEEFKTLEEDRIVNMTSRVMRKEIDKVAKETATAVKVDERQDFFSVNLVEGKAEMLHPRLAYLVEQANLALVKHGYEHRFRHEATDTGALIMWDKTKK